MTNDQPSRDAAEKVGTGQDSEREHELQTFLRQDTAEMASEYKRIYSRTTEDPGTAGDEGEENWANLLREWLPDSYKVVTKGRILGTDGTASPQIDLLVLKPAYPGRLLTKKVYLVHGVAAAFECKTTLKSAHLREAAATAAQVRKLAGTRTGTPYLELTSPVMYGVLAHSHSWKGPASTPRENIDGILEEVHISAGHPQNLIDLVCVADLECWTLNKMPYIGPRMFGDQWTSIRQANGLPEEGGGYTAYIRSSPDADRERNPVAAVISRILQHLAREHASVRPLADYFRLAGLWGAGQGKIVSWPVNELYTADVAERLQSGRYPHGNVWNEWGQNFP